MSFFIKENNQNTSSSSTMEDENQIQNIDLNISHYTNEELIQLLNLEEPITEDEVQEITNEFIRESLREGSSLKVHFFQEAQKRLYDYIEDLEEEEIETEDKDNLDAIQPTINPSGRGEPSTPVYQDEHAIQQSQGLTIQEQYSLPYLKGKINPTLKNIRTRIVNLDSQFRKNLDDTSTDFSLDITEVLHNVLSIELESFECFRSWYVFSEQFGTSSFYINNNVVGIEEGNYTVDELMNAIQSSLPSGYYIRYNGIQNKVSIDNSGGSPFDMTFYDISRNLSCFGNSKLNYNLGWLLGFRESTYSGSNTYTGESLVDVYGFRYLYVILEDRNRNRNNKGLIGIDAGNQVLDLPSYYSCDISNLTQIQTFTLNQIIQSRQSGYADRLFSPTNDDIIGKILMDYDTEKWRPLTHSNIQIVSNKREYFGPVNISKAKLQIVSDKGYIIDMNRMDYSITLRVEELYQY